MVVLKVDDRYRVLFDRQVREFLKVELGDEVLAIPHLEGVLIVSLKGRKFKTFFSGFKYREESHEASRYLSKKN